MHACFSFHSFVNSEDKVLFFILLVCALCSFASCSVVGESVYFHARWVENHLEQQSYYYVHICIYIYIFHLCFHCLISVLNLLWRLSPPDGAMRLCIYYVHYLHTFTVTCTNHFSDQFTLIVIINFAYLQPLYCTFNVWGKIVVF